MKKSTKPIASHFSLFSLTQKIKVYPVSIQRISLYVCVRKWCIIENSCLALSFVSLVDLLNACLQRSLFNIKNCLRNFTII
jgi:hypothetical protein